MTNSSSNNIMNPNAREAMDQFKMEAAAEVGVNLKQGYNGDLTSREAGSVTHKDLVQQLTAETRKGFLQYIGNLDIRTGRNQESAGVIMGQNNPACMFGNRNFQNFPTVYIHLVRSAAGNFRAIQHLIAAVQTQHEQVLLPMEGEQRNNIGIQLFQRSQYGIFYAVAEHIAPANFRHQPQQNCGILSDAFNRFQFFHAGLKHRMETPKPVQQRMGNGIGILLRHGIKQQKFQNIHIVKSVQSGLQKSLPNPGTVSGMNSHGSDSLHN